MAKPLQLVDLITGRNYINYAPYFSNPQAHLDHIRVMLHGAADPIFETPLEAFSRLMNHNLNINVRDIRYTTPNAEHFGRIVQGAAISNADFARHNGGVKNPVRRYLEMRIGNNSNNAIPFNNIINIYDIPNTVAPLPSAGLSSLIIPPFTGTFSGSPTGSAGLTNPAPPGSGAAAMSAIMNASAPSATATGTATTASGAPSGSVTTSGAPSGAPATASGAPTSSLIGGNNYYGKYLKYKAKYVALKKQYI